MSGYNSGFGAVQQAIESNSGGSSTFFTWKDGEKKIIRLLTDDVIPIGFHSFVPGLDGKNHNFVCSAQLADPRPCVICENVTVKSWKGEPKKAVPTVQTVGIAVLREEKPAEGGGIEIVDVMQDGKPVVGLIQQSNKNFWGQFTGFFARYGTTVDRDYEVTRRGSKTDTTYMAVPIDPEQNLRVVNSNGRTDVQGTRELVTKTYAKAMEGQRTIVEFIEGLGSKEYYDKFVGDGTRVTDSNGEPLHSAKDNDKGESDPQGSAQAGSADGSPAPAGAPVENNDTQFGSLRDKLTAYKRESQG